mmetsp:Transcript_25598/g.74059  ORF Transcript_25598/g.74059 Transcript_25598/m.74059 type:complete len:122 (-) Transcript_25598:97-462(-)
MTFSFPIGTCSIPLSRSPREAATSHFYLPSHSHSHHHRKEEEAGEAHSASAASRPSIAVTAVRHLSGYAIGPMNVVAIASEMKTMKSNFGAAATGAAESEAEMLPGAGAGRGDAAEGRGAS